MSDAKWTAAEYRYYARTGKMPNRDRVTIPLANVESSAGNAAKKADAPEKINPPVGIVVHSQRYRLPDSEGICAKWAIDAIVAAGILPDDSPKFVTATEFKTEQISRSESEKTYLILTSAKECNHMEKCRMKLIVEVLVDGKWHSSEKEVTGLKRLDADKINQVYELHRQMADNQNDAIQWTAEILRIDRSTVYRAIRYVIGERAQNADC